MSSFSISDENENVSSYILTSYKITPQEDNILLNLNSFDYSVTYELRPDTRFKTTDSIKDFLEKLLDKIVTFGYTLQISEFSIRQYITVYYESDDEYTHGQFTASKI